MAFVPHGLQDKANLFYDYIKYIRINIDSLPTAFILIGLILVILCSLTINQVTAQESSYLRSKTTNVPISSNASSTVFCKNGDNLLSGGYSIGFSSVRSAQNAILYANHPIRYSNGSGIFEGWKTGLINNDNLSATITALSLCLGSTIPP